MVNKITSTNKLNMNLKFLVPILLLITTGINAQTTIKIKGSDTVLPLTQKESESYKKKKTGENIIVTGGGSGVGIAALVDNSTDIAMSSRKIKLNEKMKMQDAGRAYKEVIIAWDALSIIVNPKNTVSKLTREQVEGIFTGKITNWKQVGGADMKIIAYSRESSSGTYEFFKEHVMANKNYASSVLNMPATGAIVQSVSQTPGAIGYVGLAYMEPTVKDLKISMDKGKTFVDATLANAKNKTYGIIRPLYYYYTKTTETKVKKFVDFILSKEGQAIVEQVGYVPLN